MTSGHANAGGRVIAVDGTNGKAVVAMGREEIAAVPRQQRGGVSLWDASGIFGDLVVAGDQAGRPSARTLLLLYAADLAFRLRWEIRPALSVGRIVVAAPYVDTAIAMGRAAGLPAAWLKDLFGFAPRPSVRRYAAAAPARSAGDRAGFIEFACPRVGGHAHGLTRQELTARVRSHLEHRRRQSPIASGKSG